MVEKRNKFWRFEDMNSIGRILENKINDYSVKKKLVVFYVCCVLLPLIITDSIILGIIFRGEEKEKTHEMMSIASAVESELVYTMEESAKIANALYLNRSMNEFLDKRYESDLEYFNASLDLGWNAFYEIVGGTTSANQVVMYSDNDTVINGNHVYHLDAAKQESWYEKLQNSKGNTILSFDFIGLKSPGSSIYRRVSIIRKLDYHKDLKTEKVVRVDLDYSAMARKLIHMQYNVPVYVCCGDKIIFSNVDHSSTRLNYSYLTGEEDIKYVKEFQVYGEPMRILIMNKGSNVFEIMKQYLPLIFLMLTFNIVMPGVMAVAFNRSIVSRLTELSNAFDEVEAESLKEIAYVQGKDEIGSLMHNYNRMVHRSRELIKIVYKDQMEKQQMDIARKNAELHALHSQIDPHFLFNVLEGIRMHCVLKGEEETAEMIQRLAVLERENVNWKNDMILIREEMKFIEAYLELQKHRFGERLRYSIEIDEACFNYYIPKLTLVTFVENACIHGVEKKTNGCWIYVRAYHKSDMLYLEIEDTGAGMEEDEVVALRKKMQTSSIETIQSDTHVGIANACLRLRMVTNQKIDFELDSEVGTGTFIMMKIPTENLQVFSK